jgi:hypothetical protein
MFLRSVALKTDRTAGAWQPTRSVSMYFTTRDQSARGDAAGKVVQWRRTGRAGVSSSESEGGQTERVEPMTDCHPRRFVIWPLTCLAERARSDSAEPHCILHCPIKPACSRTARCVSVQSPGGGASLYSAAPVRKK